MKRFSPWLALLASVTLVACTRQPAPLVPHSAPVRTTAVAAELVINEIDYDQPGTDAAEFIELKNTSGSELDLTGYALDLVNGADGEKYLTVALPSVSLAADDYFVVCANATTMPNCDLDVAPDTNLIQNGSPDAVALRLGDTLVDTVSYGGNTVAPYTEGSGTGLADSSSVAGLGLSRNPDGVDTNQNNRDFTLCSITPGAENACAAPPVCAELSTAVYAVQGDEDVSPLVDSYVDVQAVVVGDFQPNDGDAFGSDLGGFFLQDAVGDGDPSTSDGVFVYAPSAVDVQVGDLVRVHGRVSEYYGLTEVNGYSVVVCDTGQALPAATEVDLPVPDLAALEAVEGMRVTLPGPLAISEYFNFDRYGEIVLAYPGGDLAGAGRLFQPTAVGDPGAFVSSALAELPRYRITLDDGRDSQNPDPARHPDGEPFTLDNRFRGGDTLSDVAGVMDYRYGLYRIQPTGPATYDDANPRPAAPDPVGGDVRVAGANVLNYFTTIDTGAWICGPLADQECRGADTAAELERQRTKIVAALQGLDADVVGLTEIQNPVLGGPDTALLELVAGLNTATASGTYAAVETGTIGTDAIKVALIYRPGVVTPVGAYAILDSSVDSTFDDSLNRPALAQTFAENATGQRFTVVVNHLKSKGSACEGDLDTGDGQGNCNLTRTAAAEALVAWLATDPTGSGDPDFLLVGDYNSYDHEDPIAALEDGGFTDLLKSFGDEYAYTYLFDGLLGYLDYGLANATLEPQVTGATAWHINADEPDLLDYDMSFKPPAQDALYEPNAYRASDHDPVLVGLDLRGPSCASATPSLDMLWPPDHMFVPIDIEGVTSTGGAVTVTITGIRQDEPVDVPGSLDGNTSPDGQGVGTATAEVRAERIDGGNGRVYRIAFTATDAADQTCSGDVAVGVPNNRGRNATAIEDAPLYDSTLP